MSHFTVIVIGPNHERQLAPYHEFECTGTVDEFVQSIDKTEEYRADYGSETREESFLDYVTDYYAVDIERARREAEVEARESFGKWSRAFTEHGRPMSWTEAREAHPGNMDAARKFFNEQPAVKAMKSIWGCPVESYGFDEEVYVKRCVDRALAPFAVVKDGVWYEKGSMGWWGCVSDEKDANEWTAQVAALFDGLDPDTVVTLVDCHI